MKDRSSHSTLHFLANHFTFTATQRIAKCRYW